MKNSIDVYWGEDLGFPSKSNLLTFPLKSIVYDLKKNITDPEYLSYLKCPAFINEFKNTFVIKSPIDFSIRVDPNTLIPQRLDAETEPFTAVRSKESKLFDTFIDYLFFSSKDLEMSLIPASLHINDFTNKTHIFSGKFNISKWFRPVNLAYTLTNPVVNVKRGDALFYVKFHTNMKINFINYKISKEIEEIMRETTNLKFLKPNSSFKELYYFFTRIGYHKKLLKEIKKNITDLK